MENTDDSALNSENAWSFLEQSRRQSLEQSWAGTFRQHSSIEWWQPLQGVTTSLKPFLQGSYSNPKRVVR